MSIGGDWEFVKHQFDKLVLMLMVFACSAMLMHLHTDSPSPENRELVQFFREIDAGFVGALLGAIQNQWRRAPVANSKEKQADAKPN